MIILLVGTAPGRAIFGWVAGVWTPMRSNMWCATRGRGLKCLNCGRMPAAHG